MAFRRGIRDRADVIDPGKSSQDDKPQHRGARQALSRDRPRGLSWQNVQTCAALLIQNTRRATSGRRMNGDEAGSGPPNVSIEMLKVRLGSYK